MHLVGPDPLQLRYLWPSMPRRLWVTGPPVSMRPSPAWAETSWRRLFGTHMPVGARAHQSSRVACTSLPPRSLDGLCPCRAAPLACVHAGTNGGRSAPSTSPTSCTCWPVMVLAVHKALFAVTRGQVAKKVARMDCTWLGVLNLQPFYAVALSFFLLVLTRIDRGDASALRGAGGEGGALSPHRLRLRRRYSGCSVSSCTWVGFTPFDGGCCSRWPWMALDLFWSSLWWRLLARHEFGGDYAGVDTRAGWLGPTHPASPGSLRAGVGSMDLVQLGGHPTRMAFYAYRIWVAANQR